jgi:hypothetical protein
MTEEDRPMLLNNESINFGSMFGNINMHVPEESNRIFKNCEYFEGRELHRIDSPQRE